MQLWVRDGDRVRDGRRLVADVADQHAQRPRRRQAGDLRRRAGDDVRGRAGDRRAAGVAGRAEREGGDAAVRSTSVEPVFDTGKLWNTEPPTGTVPVNVSVVRVVVGALTVPLVVSLLQVAAANAAAATSATTAGLMSGGR